MKGELIPINKIKIPSVIYKYRNFDDKNHLAALFNLNLYIPSANQFNDPYDSNTPFGYREEELTEDNIYLKLLLLSRTQNPEKDEQFHQSQAFNVHKERRFSDPHHLEKIDKQIFQNVCNTFGILALTPNCTNLLMWSYYANSHKGFCIGYNSKYLISCGLFGMGGRVRYLDKFPQLSLFEKPGMLPKMYFAKSKAWKHEDEYRLIHRYKIGKEHKLEKEAISEVVLGCQLSDEDRLKYTDRILRFLPHVKIFQIERSKENFTLNKVPVADDSLLLELNK